MSKESYRRGAHTVTDYKYHFAWKTKYSYGILKGEIGLRLRDIISQMNLGHLKFGMNKKNLKKIWLTFSRIHPISLDDFSLNRCSHP